MREYQPVAHISETPIAEPLPIPAVRPRWPAWVVRLWPVSGATNDIAALDGLRGVAVLLTLVEHFGSAFLDTSHNAGLVGGLTATKGVWEYGWTGVTLFFVLSGFLLFLPYSRAILNRQPLPSVRKFYTRRALRILPAYWVALLLLTLIQYRTYLLQPEHRIDVLLHIFLIHNVNTATRESINPVFWTMAVESQFYLLLPLIAFGLWQAARRGGARLVGALFVLLIAISPLTGVVVLFVQANLPGLIGHIDVLDVFAYLGAFGCGILCSLLYTAATTGRLTLAAGRVRRLCQIACVLGLFILVASFAFNTSASEQTGFDQVFSFLLFGVGYAGILLGTLMGWPALAAFMAHPALRFIGIISYSLYIWNMFLFGHIVVPLADRTDSALLTVLIGLALTVIVVIPVSFAFYHLVERPFIRARQRQH